MVTLLSFVAYKEERGEQMGTDTPCIGGPTAQFAMVSKQKFNQKYD